MTTLYIREVPEAAAETLKSRAAAQGQSVSAYVNVQLAASAARPSNDEITTRLRSRDRADGVSVARILDVVQAVRR